MRESLDALQRRFLSAITDVPLDTSLPPRAPAAYLDARSHAEAAARLEMYRQMSRHRLVEVLREDFLRVHALLGDEAFFALASDYLARHPSSSPTLRDLGRGLADFIDAHAVTRERADLADIARLDWVRNEVFDAADDMLLAPADLARWDERAWSERAVVRARSVALLETRFDVTRAWLLLDAKQPPPPAVESACTLLVFRHRHVVRHRRVQGAELGALRALHRPTSLAALCTWLSADDTHDAGSAFRTLHQWLVDGLLRLA